MNVRWGTYPDHIAHEKSPGCFRCHARDPATEDGKPISSRGFQPKTRSTDWLASWIMPWALIVTTGSNAARTIAS